MILLVQKRRGFVAITAVLMLSVIFLSVSVGSVLETISGSEYEHVATEGALTRNVANACAALVLMKLTRTLEYETNDSILIEDEVCDYTIEDAEEGRQVVYVQSTVRGSTAELLITLGTVMPHPRIESWEYNPD